MAKVSLEELRKGAPAALPERSYELCLRGDLLAEMDALTSRLGTVVVSAEVAAERGQAPKRLGEQPEPPEAAEIRAKLAVLYDQTDDATGDLRLRAIPDGDWRRWVNAHPSREDDPRDDGLAFGICNADDLANELHLWVRSWNGDDLGEGDWSSVFMPGIAGGDLKALVSLVVQIQEGRDDPKLRRLALPAARTSSDADNSPEM